MGRRNRDRAPQARNDNEFERTLAAAEEDVAPESTETDGADARCTCGCRELLLQAYLPVSDGRPRLELVEVETLSCPDCGREYEAVETADGRVLRGEYLGTVDLDDDDDA